MKKEEKEKENDYIVAAFYWPAYHYEPRSEFLFPEKTGEWEIIRNAVSKEIGHLQPKVPLWGYQDEANPTDMSLKIKTALEYGVNTFLFDWYWFDKEPFLESCINNGFLKANNNRMNFYLMWANHDATTYWDVKNPRVDSVYWEGAVDREQFDIIVNRVISKYFKEPSYLKIDGEPVFCIYELNTLINGLGGPKRTKEALDYFRQKTIEAGHTGLHLQGILWEAMPSTIEGVPGDPIKSQDDVLTYFGFKSLTNYCWAHLQNPYGDYEVWGDASVNMWDGFKEQFSMTYFPNVTVSWDANPRFPFKVGYINNSTPKKFKKYLIKAKNYIDNNNIEPKIITINAWNEWSEGSYLEPDTTWGYEYLKAVRDVFEKID
ncbi:MAG: glycoside hydrolase family 99-like domain-containing protein [Dysgonamonadaceae bacterium]|nr:glycoside hydrolase family 99-like domain-containing protein [Dysgonamonadaceae bacterium]MDD4729596.1 glycoside hydrolase family 99-like domain-containing protein [Dysgonamonadaceae bacterium]